MLTFVLVDLSGGELGKKNLLGEFLAYAAELDYIVELQQEKFQAPYFVYNKHIYHIIKCTSAGESEWVNAVITTNP